MKSFVLPIAAALSCAAFTGAANAAVVTKTFDFSASNFTAVNSPATPPVDPVSGRFAITYDDAAFVLNPQSAGLTVSGFNLPYDGTARFYYNPNSNVLIISNSFSPGFSGSFTIGAGSAFGFVINNVNTNPNVNYFSYSSQGLPIYETRNVSLTPAAVPEPATWAMMIGGFGLVGGAMRNRRRQPAALPA